MSHRPGILTSEFWVTLATQVLALVALVDPALLAGRDTAGIVQAVGLFASAISAAVYALGRSRIKVAKVAALATMPPSPP